MIFNNSKLTWQHLSSNVDSTEISIESHTNRTSSMVWSKHGKKNGKKGKKRSDYNGESIECLHSIREIELVF